MSDNLPARRQAAISVDELRAIDSWDALGEFVSSASILVNRLSEYGPGLTVVTDKNALIGVPLMILDYRFNEGDSGPFVSAVAVVRTPITISGDVVSKIVINDGSTGIYSQLRSIEAERVADGTDVIRPLYCEHGLRRSDYDRKDESGNVIMNDKTGKPERATTFYLA